MRRQKIEIVDYINKMTNMSDEESVNRELMDSVFRHVDRVVKHKCVPDVTINTKEAHDYVDGLIENGDISLLRHGTVYLRMTHGNTRAHVYSELPGSITNIGDDDHIYITCSFADICRSNLIDDATQFITSRMKYHVQRMTLKATLSYIELITMLTDKSISSCTVTILSEMKKYARLSSKVVVAITGDESSLRKVRVLDNNQF